MSLAVLLLPLLALASPSPQSGPAAAARPPRLLPSPAPAAPPRPGTAGYAQEREFRERRLRESCLSEPGIRTVIEAQDRWRTAVPALPDQRELDRELSEAANAVPVDLGRLERALAARRHDQEARRASWDRETIALLRRLSPDDRGIHARGLSPMTAWPPPPTCAPERR
ncbi:MAG TPA: hypothetical protein VF605_17625 [Allosphingosinicella sp.]